MFSVHGLGGLYFRGAMEQLITVPGIRAVPANPPGVSGAQAAGGGTSTGFEHAAQAYRSMLQADADREPLHHAYQLMTRDVAGLPPWTPVEQAWQHLVTGGWRQTPVLDEAARLIGLATRENLLSAMNLEFGQVRDVLLRTVGQVMSSPVVSADPVTDVRRIARVMLDYDQPAVPVVTETGQLVGLVTRGDILRAVSANPPLSVWG